ncbi:thioesterase family protein [Halalkalibacillus halophilus]|uniref:thioesterase family protein n=1 Tax=Halalkalibacillus halophilus TaxID=392827 RepID=UPI000419C3B9|nr:thioesterase [Halalkalibacillus halophilus]
MKSGMEVGRQESIQIQVTEDMFARFEDVVVHPVYSTVAMVYHMEWVSRKIILPFLEDDEEGMGAAVQVKHIDAAPYQTTITLTATLIEHRDNLVLTTIEARHNDQLIGKGEVKQVILPKEMIQKKVVSNK